MSTQAQKAKVEKATPSPCIARQPILSGDESVVGYELFFREGREEARFSSDGGIATFSIIDTLNLIGLGVLCDGRTAFINCTHQGLLTDYFALLPPDDVVIEIQKDVPADDDVVKACQRLKQGGYSIALDNFRPDDARVALVPFANFIKVDVTGVGSVDYTSLVARYASETCRAIATKVESRQHFLTSKKAGFTWFEGYFFHHPENMQVRQIP